MTVTTLAIASAVTLWLGYRFYGQWIANRVFGVGEIADDQMPSHKMANGVDYVPTKRSILFGHHYVTIAGAGPIVGPAVAVTWGWLPALLWVVFGAILIGAVHDLGALVLSARNQGRSIGDLCAEILSPRVRLLFLIFIALALWVVLAVFAFVIASLFVARPESILAVWIEIPLAIFVGWQLLRGQSLALWGGLALLVMYSCIGIGSTDSVRSFFAFDWGGEGNWLAQNASLFWLLMLFAYSWIASVLPVQKLLQPRDAINSHQLFLALGALLVGMAVLSVSGGPQLEIVAPAINPSPPADAPLLFPFLFITIACGAVSGFHCMVASGTTSKQLASERDARNVGFGAMILEGGLAVVVILCCVSAAGFASGGEWATQYSSDWVGKGSLLARLSGFIHGGAAFIHVALPFFSLEFLATVITVVIISFAATTMDSATRIQRYVIEELARATGLKALEHRQVATAIAVISAAALALLAGQGGTGGMVLWPIFGVTNQLLASLTLVVLTTWQARRGRPILPTLLPLIFLTVTVGWAAISQMRGLLGAETIAWPQVIVLGFGMLLQLWMLTEGVLCLRGSDKNQPDDRIDALGVVRQG
ncbi:MAG: carbon starvation protein A [Planctomycetota bacterium]|nr:carbon starvation protein A [Planctomycetota bacterium]